MQSVLWSRVTSLQPSLWNELAKQLVSKRYHLHSVALMLLTAIGLGVFSMATIMPLTQWHLVSHDVSAQVAKTVVAPQQKQPTTPQLVGLVSCKQPTALSAALFANCPSLVADYSKVKMGKVNGSTFNIYQGPPVANEEAQLYTSSTKNLRVENGSLVLEAHNEARSGYRYTSARIDTKYKKDFLYGKFVIRAMLPNGVGTWPAIWMLPSTPRYASLSPADDKTSYLNDGEIDIVEAIGSEPNTNYSVAHSLAYSNDGVDRQFFNTIVVPGATTAFHDYQMDWTPTKLTFMVDGRVYFVYNKQADATYYTWPFDQPFYLVLNLALGGNWAGQDRADFPIDGVDVNALPASLRVQSIKYYSYIGPK